MKRPFRGLSRRRGPDESYDVVVIGAGVGGLTCANLLARRGLKVLLVEQHYMAGGYCSAFRRGGYVFDAAAHFYPLLGNPETITGRLLRELGVATGWVKMDPVDQFHLPDGSRFAVPAEFAPYLAALKAQFPDEAARLDEFFALVRRMYVLGVMCYFRDKPPPWVGPYARWTVRDVIERHFRSPRLKLLLTADCAHWGSPPGRTSFLYDAMLRYSYFLGNYFPRGGSQAFADELALRFEERGGHVLLNCRVSRILTAGGAACGVELETGPVKAPCLTKVRAGAVVSNADLRQTVTRLLDPARVDPAYLAAVSRLRPTYPCFLTHLGLRGVAEDDLARAHGYHWTGWDSERVGARDFVFKLFAPTLYDPDLAPPGGQVLIVQKVLATDYDAVTDWAAEKRAVEEYVLEQLGRILPGIDERIVVKLSASAFTSYRYTLNYQGAMLGWEMAPDQVGDRRPGLLGPVARLFLVGHWTQPGGGITPVIVSAMRVAAEITGESEGGMPGPPSATGAREDLSIREPINLPSPLPTGAML